MEEVENIKLSPLMEPSPVAFSMDTIGWKILFVLLLIIIMYSAYKFYLHYKHNKYRRIAVSKIIEVSQLPDNELPSMITQIMFQIKQTALQTFGREKVAALQGDPWLQFLEETANGVHFVDYKDIIISSVYKGKISAEGDFDKMEFVKNSIKWIKRHA